MLGPPAQELQEPPQLLRSRANGCKAFGDLSAQPQPEAWPDPDPPGTNRLTLGARPTLGQPLQGAGTSAKPRCQPRVSGCQDWPALVPGEPDTRHSPCEWPTDTHRLDPQGRRPPGPFSMAEAEPSAPAQAGLCLKGRPWQRKRQHGQQHSLSCAQATRARPERALAGAGPHQGPGGAGVSLNCGPVRAWGGLHRVRANPYSPQSRCPSRRRPAPGATAPPGSSSPECRAPGRGGRAGHAA